MSKKGYKVLVIGDAIIDHYIFGKINRYSPENPAIPIVDIERTDMRLGGALNVAANIKSLRKTVDVSVASVLNEFCSDELRYRQINSAHSIFAPGDSVLIKTRVVNSQDNKQLIRFDKNQRFSDYLVQEFVQFYLKKINLNIFDCIVVSDYLKGIITSEVITALQNFKGTVFIDTKNPDLSIWSKIPCAFMKINKKEWDNSKQRANHPVIVTVGDKGAQLRNTQYWRDFPTELVENPDVVGAGDVFLAGLVVRYLESNDIYEAITYANKAATESVKRQGTVEVKLDA